MKLKELLEKEKGNYTDIEIYRHIDNKYARGVHTDNIEYITSTIDNDILEEEINEIESAIMCEEEYNNTICANGCVSFLDMYLKNDKILVVILKKDMQNIEE